MTTNATNLGHQVADIYLEKFITHTPPPSVAADAASLQAKAGLYRSTRDHHTQSIEFHDGALRMNGRPLLQETPAVFAESVTGPKVEFTENTLRIITEEDPNNIFDRVDPVNLTAEQLTAFVGDYASGEADVTYRTVIEGGKIVLHRRADPPIPLTATYEDGFNSTLGTIRFLRDTSGRVTEMSIGRARVWDLRLHKLM